MNEISRLLRSLLVPTSEITLRDKALRHMIVGGCGTVFYFGFVTTLVELFSLSPVVAVIIAFILLHAYLYLANRSWVYGATNRHRDAMVKFIILVAISFSLNTGIMYLTTDILEAWYVWGLILATILVPVTNFLANTFWVFR